MEGNAKFKVKYLDNVITFLNTLDKVVQRKIIYNVYKSSLVLDKELFKKLNNTDIWEFRTLYNKTAYRLFAFWDTEEDALVVITHGIIKKDQKTPRKEIERAEAIRKEYLYNKRLWKQ